MHVHCSAVHMHARVCEPRFFLQDYLDLTFRHAVVAREGNGKGVLNGAVQLDADQMFCFLRWLDQDCDGLISLKEFCR